MENREQSLEKFLEEFRGNRQWRGGRSRKIKITKGVYLSARDLRKISNDIKKRGLPLTRESIIEGHYKLQLAHPLKRIISIVVGSVFIFSGLAYHDSLTVLLITVPAGVVFVLLGVRGRKKELNTVFDVSTDTTIDSIDFPELIVRILEGFDV